MCRSSREEKREKICKETDFSARSNFNLTQKKLSYCDEIEHWLHVKSVAVNHAKEAEVICGSGELDGVFFASKRVQSVIGIHDLDLARQIS